MPIVSILLSPLVAYYAYRYKSRHFGAWFILAILFNSFIMFILLLFLRRLEYKNKTYGYVSKFKEGIDVNSPIRLESYNIYTNNRHDKTGLTIHMRNISNKTVTAVNFIAEGYNYKGSKLQFNTDEEYIISINNFLFPPSHSYSNDIKTIIPLVDSSIDRIHLDVHEVLFSDGSVFVNTPLIKEIKEDEIPGYATQLARSYVKNANVFCEDHDNYWICACGAINIKENKYCYRCKNDKLKTFEVMTRDNFRPIYNEAQVNKKDIQ